MALSASKCNRLTPLPFKGLMQQRSTGRNCYGSWVTLIGPLATLEQQ